MNSGARIKSTYPETADLLAIHAPSLFD